MEESHAFAVGSVGTYKKPSNFATDDNMTEANEKDAPYCMSGILHFLQTEWTKFEIERSQWEVEKAELQARVAFLQGERKGQENLKHDLVRRQPGGQQSKKAAASDLEPFHTFRGHTGPVVAACLAGDLLFSASLDATVRAWRVPPLTVDPYDAFDSSLVGPVLVGHRDAVWGTAVTAGDPDGATLYSVGADRTLRAWRPAQAEEPLLGTWALEQQPTSVSIVATDPAKLVVSFQSGQCHLMDAETGQIVSQLAPGDEEPGGCNRALSHPTQGLTVAAYEDRHIRFYDNGSRAMVHSMVAHLDSVTSLAVDPNGLYLLSGSHDCSVRLWSLDDRTCVQEITAHRKKFDEAIHDVALHASRSFLASAGADGLAKVFV